MVSLIGVHGVGNRQPGHPPGDVAQTLATAWREHLQLGPLGAEVKSVAFTVSYYAHHLAEPGRQAGRPELDDLSGEDERMARCWLDEWHLQPGIPQGLGTMPLRQAIGILADHFGFPHRALELFVAVFFREVTRYLRDNDPHRTAACADVAVAIAAAREPRVVLAHSLGSVVAYEALSAYPHVAVELLVTMGSPLAMPGVVYPRLNPAPQDGRCQRPSGVKRWINIADPGDVIAIPRHGVSLKFAGVDEDREACVHWADFHLAANYLKTSALAEILRPFLRRWSQMGNASEQTGI